MFDAFKILHPLDIAQNGLTSPRLQLDTNNDPFTIDLTKSYPTLTEENLQHHVYFLRKYGQEYDLENLDWSLELLENSCDTDLREKVNEKIQSLHQGLISGPIYFYYVITLISSTSETVANTIINRLDNLHLNQTEGENVSTVVSLVKGAVKHLQNVDHLPQDINTRVIKIFQTTSAPDFNDIFTYMSNALKLKQCAFTTDEILNIAEENYTELVTSNRWSGASKQHSTFYSPNVTCHGCGARGHVLKDCPNTSNKHNSNQNTNNQNACPDVDLSKLQNITGKYEFNHPVFTTPPAKGIKAKKVNGTPHCWCHHCGRWQKSHGTQGHTGPKRGSNSNNTNNRRGTGNRNNHRNNNNNEGNLVAQQPIPKQIEDDPQQQNSSDSPSVSSHNTTSTFSSGFMAAAQQVRRTGTKG